MAKSITLKYGALLLCITTTTCIARTALLGQASTTPEKVRSQVESTPILTPSFELATIKLHNPDVDGMLGFYSYPGGRVTLGSANLKMLIYYAFDVQEFQVSGVPAWADKNHYDIVALPPPSSKSRGQSLRKATPTDEQREMLQTLLIDRFALKFHRETKKGAVYLLLRGKGQLHLEAPKNPNLDSRGDVNLKVGGIADGSAFGTNMSMPFLARQLSERLQRPVLDQTGLQGRYDFELEPDDPSNRDMTAAVIDAMRRLGLKLKAAKGPVETIVIDSVAEPTEN